jgi:hypothetical protein
VASAINGLNSWIDAVALDPFKLNPLAATLNPPAALANGSPALVVQTPTNPLWGNNNGTAYQDINIGLAIATTNTALNVTSSNPNPILLTNHPVIGSITLQGGDWLNQLSVTYDLPSGPTTFTHGETTGGTPDYPINLQQGEFITSITGTYGDYINQLTLATNLGQTYTYPTSPASADGVVKWTAADGEVLVGFQGACGTYLNQLQLITLQFQPSLWSPPLLVSSDPDPSLPVTGVGVGYNTFLNAAMPNSAAVAPASVGSLNQASQNFVQVYTNSGGLDQTLHHSIGLSAEGQSVKHQNSSSLQTSNTDVTVVVYANAIKSSPIYGTATLLPAAASLCPSELFTAYGDSYVSAAVMGADYAAVFIYECDSEDQQQSVLNSLALQGVVPSDPPVSIGVNFSKSMSDANSQITVNCRVVQLLRGSAAQLPAITSNTGDDIEALVSFALALSVNDVDGEGVVLDYATTGYETLMASAQASAFAPIVNNRQIYAYTVSPSLASLRSIGSQMQQLASLYKTYGYTGDTTFYTNCQQLNQDTATLEDWIGQTNANPLGTATLPATLQSLINGTPAAQFQFEKSQSCWGGSTAGATKNSGPAPSNAFYDLATSWASGSDPTNASDNSSNPTQPIPLAERPVLAAIDLWGGGQINQIATSYQTTSGTVQFVHGDASAGWQMPSFNLAEGEFITSINGSAGWYVGILTMNTNRGQSVTWFPTCDSGVTPFSWSVPDGATLVGFEGWSGQYLNILQPVYIQFQPASWGSVAQYVPPGTYQQSSSEITVTLQAQCKNSAGTEVSSTLTYTASQAMTIGDISNDNGNLTIVTGNGNLFNSANNLGIYVPSGSYQNSSSSVSVTLSAHCLNGNQQSVPASLTYTSTEAASFANIANTNGALVSLSST